MGFYYEEDPEKRIDWLRFKCSCGHTEAMRVKVRKPSGVVYETEFAECVMCRLMYHWPLALEGFKTRIPEAPAPSTRQGGRRTPP